MKYAIYIACFAINCCDHSSCMLTCQNKISVLFWYLLVFITYRNKLKFAEIQGTDVHGSLQTN